MKYYSVLFFLFVLSDFAWSQTLIPATEAQKKDIFSQITRVAASTNSLQCHFIQNKKISVLSETITSEGIMYFKKENNLRWQYNKPYSFIFILSGGKVLVKNDSRVDKFDVNSNKMFREISEIMIGGVRGDLLSNDKKFTAQYFVGNKTVMVKLTPKNKELKQIMNTINLTFSKTDWLVQSIEMIEQGGDNTLITFTEKNVNKTISDDLFRIN